jgi:hypothetical protein
MYLRPRLNTLEKNLFPRFIRGLPVCAQKLYLYFLKSHLKKNILT